ncbi:MAG: Type pantothenate kinase [Gemmatimonadetes bacterium]|nr:Type pantothenate kinase [Gemmatimonadota bacterium]
MILAFDVGNTETTIGCFHGESLRGHWRITTDAARTPDELGMVVHALLLRDGIAASSVTGIAIGSVVPPVTAPLAEACRAWLGELPVVIVDARAALPIRLDVEEPLSVGADRIINTLAASRLHGRDAIVVDLGTATTFDCITRDGVFIGGVIMPGVRSSAETLFRRTSKLPATEIEAPQRVIGRRTEECIRSGVLYGAADAIDGVVRRIKGEWPGAEVPLVIATGGLAEAFKAHCREFDEVDPFLTLVGLRLAFEILSK